jgi:hypothetical protein
MGRNNFLSYVSQAKGFVPKVDFELCKQLANDARRDIYSARLWSFLIVETQFTCPAIITAGTASFTQYSKLVTGNVTASLAWTGLANPVLTMRQIRQSGGPLYNITAANFANPSAVVLTLDRPYQETTASGQAYNLYQAFYPAIDPATGSPTADIEKWVSVFDPINGYPLKLNKTQEWLNRVDPQRGDIGQAYYVCTYKSIPVAGNGGIDPIPFWELWPHPTDGVSRIAFYKAGAQDWSASNDAMPTELPIELLEARTRYREYEWAEANKGSHPELQKTNWLALMRSIMDPTNRAGYPYLLSKAKKQDEERFQINFCSRPNTGYRFPIDSDFLQAHEFSWDFPNEAL